LAPLVSALSVGSTVPFLRYKLNMGSGSASQLPVSVKTAWKCEPTLTSLIIQFRAVAVTKPMVLKNTVLEVTINGGVSGVQCKPDAQWDQASQTARWHLGDVTIQPGQEHNVRILARFVVQTASTPSPLSVTFAVDGQLLSKTGVELATEADERVIDLRPAEMKLTTSKYYAVPAPPTQS